jgi:hypothetical protein
MGVDYINDDLDNIKLDIMKALLNPLNTWEALVIMKYHYSKPSIFLQIQGPPASEEVSHNRVGNGPVIPEDSETRSISAAALNPKLS